MICKQSAFPPAAPHVLMLALQQPAQICMPTLPIFRVDFIINTKYQQILWQRLNKFKS